MKTLRLALAASMLVLPLLAASPALGAKDFSPGEMPARGMRMSKVRDLYGEPRATLPAVGRPPITRWLYNEYTVYFEGKTVIESVRAPVL